MNEDRQAARYREHEEENTKSRAAILNVPYLDTRESAKTNPLVDGVLSVEEMYKGRMVPLEKGNDSEPYVFGVTNNTPQSFIRELRKEYADDGKMLSFMLISGSGYREFMRRYDPPKEVVYDDVKIAKAGDSETIESVSKTLDSVRTDDILNYLIEQADSLGASDIHLENQRDDVRVRLRVDGALHPVAKLSHDKYRILLASIASRSNISTADTNAQAGSMNYKLEKDGKTRFLNMRVESIPTVYGQDVVVRLFNFDETLLNLDNIGVNEKERKEIDEIIAHPRGMVLMVGPTGSGKSTTLYGIINALNTTDRKIITLEDPVEYRVPGVSQIPVDTNKGQSFAEDFRGVLRLDPDVVMVGEIRDADTAHTAVQASITGHLVLSTFHADSASAAFSRMIDMIGTNPVFSTAIRLVISQRLVRKLDDKTKKAYKADEATKKWLREALKDLPDSVKKPKLDGEVTLYKPVTSDDSPFGYSGRLVIMEQLVVNESIQKFLRGDESEVNAEAIEKTAKKNGMITMLQNGVLRALKGETTIEEVNRVL